MNACRPIIITNSIFFTSWDNTFYDYLTTVVSREGWESGLESGTLGFKVWSFCTTDVVTKELLGAREGVEILPGVPGVSLSYLTPSAEGRYLEMFPFIFSKQPPGGSRMDSGSEASKAWGREMVEEATVVSWA